MESSEQFIERKNREWEATRGQPSIKTKDIGRKGSHGWARDAWTFHVQHNLPEKVFVFERLRYCAAEGEQAYSGGAKPGDIEYRLGYYIRGQIGRRAGRWTWGQFCPFIPAEDWDPLIKKAQDEGTLLTEKA